MTAALLDLDTWWDLPSGTPDTTSSSLKVIPRLVAIESSLRDWVKLPEVKVAVAPEPQLQAKEILDWTGFSRRQLSSILGITHPTLKALVEGRATQLSKKPEVPTRIAALHGLCERIAPLANYDQGLVASALLTEVRNDGSRIADIVMTESVAAAYLAALKVVAPKTPPSLRPVFAKREVGTATVSLSE